MILKQKLIIIPNLVKILQNYRSVINSEYFQNSKIFEKIDHFIKLSEIFQNIVFKCDSIPTIAKFNVNT